MQALVGQRITVTEVIILTEVKVLELKTFLITRFGGVENVETCSSRPIPLYLVEAPRN